MHNEVFLLLAKHAMSDVDVHTDLMEFASFCTLETCLDGST